MLTPLPLLIMVLCALIGAAVLAYALRGLHLPAFLPPLAGALGGAAGSLLFVGALGFCTFEPERDALDQGFGVLLMGIGAGIALGLLGSAFYFLGRRKVNTAVPVVHPGQFKGWLMPLVLLAPTLIILALFLYYPSIDTFRLSTLLTRLGAPRTIFVCVKNFTDLARDPLYGQIVLQTVFLSVSIVVIGLSLSLLVALMAFQPIRGANIYRTLLIWPYSISPVVAGLIFLLLFNPAGGLINHFLQGVFGVQVGWLNNPQAAPWAVIVASVWKSMGFNILFYIAGLQNVPRDLGEAASIDGANAIERLFRITIPMLAPITFFLVITNMTYAFFESFGTIDALTSGGPLNSTTTMMYQIYEVGIQNNDLGKGAAQSLVLLVMVIGLTVFQFRSAARSATS